MARCVGGLVRETIDLPSKPSQGARRYTENIPVDDRTDACRGDTGESVISVIISVDADSEKMEPRCQQLEGTTSAPLAEHFSSCQEDNTDREKLPSLQRPIFLGKKHQGKNLFAN